MFSSVVDKQTKKQLMEDEFGIPLTDRTKDEVEEMCNLSNGVERRGIEKGRAEGKIEGVVASIRSLMKNMNLPAEKAMTVLGIAPVDFGKYLPLL